MIFEYFFVQFFAELQRIFRSDDRPRDRRKVSVSCLKLGVASGDGEFIGIGGGWLESSLIEVDNKLYDIYNLIRLHSMIFLST
jgi:hypothetical protein